MRRNSTVRELELTAAKIRRTVLEMSRVRGGYAAQGVALADIAATLYFDEMRPDGEGWFKDRFVLSNGHDAIMTYGALAHTGHYTMEQLTTINADGSLVDDHSRLARSGAKPICRSCLGTAPTRLGQTGLLPVF